MRFPLRWFLAAASAGAAFAAPEMTQSLAGSWRFALDRAAEQTAPNPEIAAHLPPGDGVAQKWYAQDLPDKIELPGILQAQGYGNDISPATPWVLTLGDAWWKLPPAALRERFSQPGKTAVPFLAQPPKHYLGVAWYQRDIEIPAGWQGRPVTLFLERAHWETTVWLDEVAFPPEASLVAPHVTALGVVAPGHHRLTIRVDNRRIVADPANNQHGDDSHSTSDALGAAWNGIVGRLELKATSPVWIEDAQVYPDVARKLAHVKVRIGNATGRAGGGQLAIGKVTATATWQAEGGRVEIDAPLGDAAQTWDEFHPALQHLTLKLTGPNADDTQGVTFGLREIVARGRDFVLNGRVINLRLTHSGGDFPLTGYPAMEVAGWKKIFRVCQDYGLNGMRFHSWCPPEAAFTAADEMGFYLQPECGLWSPFSPGSAFTVWLEAETARLLRAYGNHPSFLLLSPGNEPAGHYQQVTPPWAAAWYRQDNRRLYSAGTGWADPSQVTGGAQFATLVRYAGGELRNASGWFGQDYATAVAQAGIPILAHEVGQWCAYPDFDVIKEFTGYLRPGNFEIFRAIAADTGVLPFDHAFARASGKFQVACYKEEIEANLRTPGLAGYQLLDLHDYLGQGTALIGVVDAFWKPKSSVTAAEFRRFNQATVPLTRLARRTFTTAETLETPVELYHFGERPLVAPAAFWKIVAADGRVAAEGTWPARDIPIGKNFPLGDLHVPLAKFAAPQSYRLVVGLHNSRVENDWNFWVYPAAAGEPAAHPAAGEGVLATRDWDAAAARLAAGGKVLFVPGPGALDPARCPPLQRVPVFWNIQMTVRPPRNPAPRFDAMLGLWCDAHHPALAEFPTGEACDWQWTPLIDGVPSVNLTGAPASLQPIVAAIDDWNRNWRLGVIFEMQVGPGRLLVSALDVTAAAPSPGLAQLRRSLLDYMASARFAPTAMLTPEAAHALWPGVAAPAARPARALDPDLDDGSGRPARPRQP